MNDIRTMRIDKITFDDVQAFCEAQIPEDVRLDYKREVPRDLARVIASFANTQGGTLVLGVGADRDHRHRPEPTPRGAELGLDIRRTIAEVCATQIWPPVSPEVSDFIRQSDSAARGFCVVRIPMSDQVPHTVENKTGIYIRVNDRSGPVPADVDNIAFLLNQRDKTQALQGQRRTYVLDAVEHMIDVNPGFSLILASIGPTVSARDLTTPQSLRDQARDLFLGTPLFSDRYSPFRGTVCGMANGVYVYEPQFNAAAAVDIFGNVVVGHGVSETAETGRLTPDSSEDSMWGDTPMAARRFMRSSTIGTRIVAGVAAAQKLFDMSGFDGAIELTMYVRRASGLGLINFVGSSRYTTLCVFRGGAEIRAAFPCDAITFRRDPFLTAIPALDRLVWAWGLAEVGAGLRVGQAALRYMKSYSRACCNRCKTADSLLAEGVCLRCAIEAIEHTSAVVDR